MEKIWRDLIQSLEEQMDAQAMERWIKPITFEQNGATKGILYCPSDFFAKWIRRYYLDHITRELNKLTGLSYEMNVEVVPSSQTVSSDPRRIGPYPRPNKSQHEALVRPAPFNPRYTFERFVVGESNRFAYNAAKMVATDAATFYNPFYILSDTGLGKTHLATAIAHAIWLHQSRKRILLVSADEFMNEVVRACLSKGPDKFKEKYRQKCDVLIIDDVQFLQGKQKTQEELYFTMNKLLDAGKQIICTSNVSPMDIPNMGEELKSRFCAGLVAEMKSPDTDTRREMLRRMAAWDGIMIGDEVIEYLAATVSSNVRILEGGLHEVAAKGLLLHQPIDLGMAKESLRTLGGPKQTKFSFEAIFSAVEKYYHISRRDLSGRCRKQRYVVPRQIAMYLCRKYTDATWEAIGKEFNKNHSTVCHSVKKIQKAMRERPQVAYEVELVEKLLKGLGR